MNADALTNEQLVEVPNLTAFTAHYLASKSDFKDVVGQYTLDQPRFSSPSTSDLFSSDVEA